MTIKVALIGVGEQGFKNILPSLFQVENAEVSALVDVNESRVKKVANSFGIKKYYTNYKLLIENERIDAVLLACPPQVHVEVARYVLSRGISVFAEKPPTVTLAEIQELNALSQKRKVITGVGLNFRYSTPYQKLHKIVSNNNFGKPCLLNIKHYANKPTDVMWGLKSKIRSLLLAQAIHPLDLLLSYGDEIQEQYFSFFSGDKGMIIRVNVIFENGLMGCVVTGSLFPHFESSVEVVSDTGKRATLDSLWNLHLSHPDNATAMLNETKRWSLDWDPSPLDSGYERSGYYGEIKTFIDAIEKGKAFEPSFGSQIRVYKLMDDIEESYVQKYGSH